MKKLTAGIFTVLMGLVSVNAADAAVASKGYVDQVAKNTADAASTALNTFKTDTYDVDKQALEQGIQDAKDALTTFQNGTYATDKSNLQIAIDSKVATETYNTKLGELDQAIANIQGGELNITAGAVGTTELKNDAVTAEKIAENAVGSSEIAENAVGTSEIAADAVTADEIATGAVGTSEIADGSVALADLNAEVMTEVDTKINTKVESLDGATGVASTTSSSFVQSTTQADGTVTVTTTNFANEVTDDGVIAPTSAAVAGYVGSAISTINSNVATKQDMLGGDNVVQSGTGVVKTVVAEDGTLTATASLVAEADIADSNVTTMKIADSAVTTAKIANGNVTDEKIESVSMSKVTGLEAALGAKIPAPSGDCANPANKCTLVFKGGQNIQANYEWEVIERGTEGEFAGL